MFSLTECRLHFKLRKRPIDNFKIELICYRTFDDLDWNAYFILLDHEGVLVTEDWTIEHTFKLDDV